MSLLASAMIAAPERFFVGGLSRGLFCSVTSIFSSEVVVTVFNGLAAVLQVKTATIVDTSIVIRIRLAFIVVPLLREIRSPLPFMEKHSIS